MKVMNYPRSIIWLFVVAVLYSHSYSTAWNGPVTVDTSFSLYDTSKAFDIAYDTVTNTAMILSVSVNMIGNKRLSARPYTHAMGWGSATIISDSIGEASIASTGSGKFCIVFSKYSSTNPGILQIRTVQYAANSWNVGTMPVMNFAPLQPAMQPSIAASPADGTIFILWKEFNTTWKVYATRCVNSVWDATPTLLSDSEADSTEIPRIAVSNQNSATAVFIQLGAGSKTLLYSKQYTNSGWGTITLLSSNSDNSYSPQIAMNRDNKALCVYVYSCSGSQLYSKYYSGTVWDSPLAVDAGIANCGLTQSVLQYESSQKYVVFYSNNSQLYARQYNGSSWNSSQQVTTASLVSNNFSFSYDSTLAKGMIAYQEGTNLYVKEYNNGIVQSSRDTLSMVASSSAKPKIVVTNDGSRFVVYIQDSAGIKRCKAFTSSPSKMWTNSGGDFNWNNPLNWTPQQVPQTGDNIVFHGGISNSPCIMPFSDTITSMRFVNYTGIFTSSTYSLSLLGDADFSGLDSLSGSGNLHFLGTNTQQLTVHSGLKLPPITKTRSCSLSVHGNMLICETFTVDSGMVSVDTTDMTIQGGLILQNNAIFRAGSGTLRILQDLLLSSGSAVFYASVDSVLLSGSLINTQHAVISTAGTKGLYFVGSSPNCQVWGGNNAFHKVSFTGTGTWICKDSLIIDSLILIDGTLRLGNYVLHTIATLKSIGFSAMIDFDTSYLRINRDLDLSQIGTCVTDIGLIDFAATTGTQVISLRSGIVLPNIGHQTASTLQFSGNSLSCTRFINSNGIIDFNGLSLTVRDSLCISNGNDSTFKNHAATNIIVTVGSAYFGGTVSSYLNMNPSSLWNVNLPVGNVYAIYARIKNCILTQASGSAQTLFCVNEGGNVNWFVVSQPPDFKGIVTANQRTDSSKIVQIQYKIFDPDNATVTVSMHYFNGSSWQPATHCTNAIGSSVSASDSLVLRTIEWNAYSQLGACEVTNYNVKIIATDQNGIDTTLLGLDTLTIDTYNPRIATSLQRGSVGDSTVTLIWQSAIDNTFRRYGIYYGTDSITVLQGSSQFWSYTHDSLLNNRLTTTTTIRHLLPRVKHYFVLVASDRFGNVTKTACVSAVPSLYAAVPTNITLSSASVQEHKIIGTPIGILRAIDSDSNDIHTFSFVSGVGDNNNAHFSISSDTVKTAAVFDFEAQTQYSIRIKVTDLNLNSFEKTFIISIDNINEAPNALLLSNASIDENKSIGSCIGVFSTVDQSMSQSHTYALTTGQGSVDNNSFFISSDTLKSARSFNFENRSAYSIRVRTQDDSGSIYDSVFAITINNKNDVPYVQNIAMPDTAFTDTLFTAYIRIADQDKYDSVVLQQIPLISWLTITKSKLSDTVWQYTLIGTPTDSFLGKQYIELFIKDTQGGKISLHDSLYIAKRNNSPNTVLRIKEQSFGAVKYVVYASYHSAAQYKDSLFTFFGTMKSVTNYKFLRSSYNTTGTFMWYPLLDGTYIFSCYAVDQHARIDSTALTDTIVISQVTSRTLKDTGTWSLFSVPAKKLDPATIKEKSTMSCWDESKPYDETYKYYTKSESITKIEAGKSYWSKVSSAIQLSIAESSLIADTFSIVLNKARYGWNQIGSPYAYPVAWTYPQTLWKWNSTRKDYERIDNVLYPWEGYWVYTDSAITVSMNPIPYFGKRTSPGMKKLAFSSLEDWNYTIQLTSQRYTDLDNSFGMDKNASDGYDNLDQPEPPRIEDSPMLYFINTQGNPSVQNYASDFRKNFNEQAVVFQVGISGCSNPHEKMRLCINGYKAQHPIYLYIVTPTTVTPYTEEMKFEIPVSAQPQYYALFVTKDKKFLESYPHAFSFSSPYPNPSRNSITIRYTIPYRWNSTGMLTMVPDKVTVVVYDIRGRLLSTIVNQNQNPGTYQVMWSGKGNTGSSLASGTYLIRLSAGNNASVKKIIMLH